MQPGVTMVPDIPPADGFLMDEHRLFAIMRNKFARSDAITRGLMPIALLAVFVASDACPKQAWGMEYAGICEASAGAFIDNTHFVVASDETNRLQLYERGNPKPIGDGIDMESFTSFDKSDLEGAALIGDRVYWISSHSFNRQGEDKSKRKVFFATRIVKKDSKPTLVGLGSRFVSLRDAIAKAAGVEHSKLNIEGLAATPDGGLLIGLRAPLGGTDAIVVPFRNPAAVVDQGAQPEFGRRQRSSCKAAGSAAWICFGSDGAILRDRRRSRRRQRRGICAVSLGRSRSTGPVKRRGGELRRHQTRRRDGGAGPGSGPAPERRRRHLQRRG